MEILSTGTNTAGAGGTKRHNGHVVKIIASQKGLHDLGRLSPPDRVTQKHHIIILRMLQCSGNSGPGIGIILFQVSTAVTVAVIEIVIRIRLLGDDLIEVSIQNSLDILGNMLCIAGGRKIGHQHTGFLMHGRLTLIWHGGNFVFGYVLPLDSLR